MNPNLFPKKNFRAHARFQTKHTAHVPKRGDIIDFLKEPSFEG